VSRPAAGPGGLARAYDQTGDAWGPGPARLVYDRLAEVLVGMAPAPLVGRHVLDLGAGTGAASRRVVAAGGRPVAVDVSVGMLRANPAGAGSAVVGDATRIPLATASVDGVVAAFSFNHLPDPAAGFREVARVARRGAPVVVGTYAADDDHPVKQAVDRALGEAGWILEPWYETVRSVAAPQLATTDGMLAAAHEGGLDGRAEQVAVDLPDLDPDDLIAWRLGLAQAAPFVRQLPPAGQTDLRDRARSLLGPNPPPLRRSIVVFTGVV